MITRRGLFGLLPALGAVALPAADKKETVEPIILEHTCDRGWHLYTDDERAMFIRDGSDSWLRGCGTTFRWHFGVPPYCPKCGCAYSTVIAHISSGRYKIVQGKWPSAD